MFYRKFCFWYALVSLLFHCSLTQEPMDKNASRAFILSFGGINKHSLYGMRMQRLFERGVYSLLGTGFPTISEATQFSIATGLYPQDHGVYMNPFLDFETGKWINIHDEQFFNRKKVEPIWVANQANGGISACVNWPGAEFKYNDVRCTYVERFNESSQLRELSSAAIKRLYHDFNSPNLIMLYFDKPRRIGEAFGPDSWEYSQAVREVDDFVMYFYYQILASPFQKFSNIFVLGDHYFVSQPYTHEKKENDLSGLQEKGNLFQVMSPYARFKFESGQRTSNLLQRFKETVKGQTVTFYHSSIPEHWFSGKAVWGDALVFAKPGTIFYDIDAKVNEWKQTFNWTDKETLNRTIGISGFDNSMDIMKGMIWWYGKDSNKAPNTAEIDVTDIKSYVIEVLSNNKNIEDPGKTIPVNSQKIHQGIFSFREIIIFSCSLNLIGDQ